MAQRLASKHIGSAVARVLLGTSNIRRWNSSSTDSKITLSAAEWKQRLSPQEYRVLRNKGTEFPNTGTFQCDIWYKNQKLCELLNFDFYTKHSIPMKGRIETPRRILQIETEKWIFCMQRLWKSTVFLESKIRIWMWMAGVR